MKYSLSKSNSYKSFFKDTDQMEFQQIPEAKNSKFGILVPKDVKNLIHGNYEKVGNAKGN